MAGRRVGAGRNEAGRNEAGRNESGRNESEQTETGIGRRLIGQTFSLNSNY